MAKEYKNKHYADKHIPWYKLPYKPRYDGWEMKFSEGEHKGEYRCQAMLHNNTPNTANKDVVPHQCKGVALKNFGYCRKHTRNATVQQAVEGSGQWKGLVRKEIAAIDKLPKEELETVDGEIKVLMGILRAIINNYTDEDIIKHPGRIAFVVETIARIKKMKHEMEHGQLHVYRFEMVQYIFQEVKLSIMKNVKNAEEVKAIAKDLQRIGITLSEKQK